MACAAVLQQAAGTPVLGQTLGDTAAREAERRAQLPSKAYVYTEVDVSRLLRRGLPDLDVNVDPPAVADGPVWPAAGSPTGAPLARTPFSEPAASPTARAEGRPAAQDQRAILDLYVNELPLGETVVLLRDGSVWLPAPALARAGLSAVAAVTDTATGTPYVALAPLAPEVTYELDEPGLTLRVSTRPELLRATARDLSFGRPAGMIHPRTTSGFLNYGLNWRGRGVFDATAEAGLSVRGALLQTTISRSSQHTWLRGLTGLTIDDRRRLVRWTVGDLYVPAGPLGGGFVMGGVGVSREFSIDPYYVRYPTVTIQGNAMTPSTAEIYVNNHLLRREYLPPGEFQLRNLPTPTGRGMTRVVMRDAFGREQQIVSPYFITTSLLGRGLQEYRYQLGARRLVSGSSNWQYDRLSFLGRHRIGLTTALTGGGQVEAGPGLLSGGPSITASLPRGEIEASAALSRDPLGRAGFAGTAAYTYVGRPLSLGAMVRRASDHYATIAAGPRDDRLLSEASGYAGVMLGRAASISVRHLVTSSSRRGRETTTTLSASGRAWLPVDLFVNAARTRRPGAVAYEVFAGAMMSVGGRTTASVTMARAASGPSLSIETMQALPRGEGWGYRARVADSPGRPLLGSLQYQGRWGRYDAGYETIGHSSSPYASLAGGLAFIGGGIYATRPIADAYALVRVPGVPGVRAYASQQVAGRTGRRGAVLVPDLLSHYGNVLGIADDDVPLDHAIGSSEAIVAPSYRGGAVVEFSARPLRGAAGRVRWRAGSRELVPQYGQLILRAGGQVVQSPIGKDGEFFLEQVVPGDNPARIEHLGEACDFVLRIPATVAPVVDLGTLICDVTLAARR